MERRQFFVRAGVASLLVPAAGLVTTARADDDPSRRIDAGIRDFLALSGTKSFLITFSGDGASWSRASQPDEKMFVGSAVKVFILAEFLRRAERDQLSEDTQLCVDDRVRSINSPIFRFLTGTTTARTVLEGMISHSDNTATDVALAQAGVANVRAHIAAAGLSETLIPDSTRRLFSYLAGAPAGVDVGWAGMEKIEKGGLFGTPRSPLNKTETMQSTAQELVAYYRSALAGAFFGQPETLAEFRRILTMGDAVARVVPVQVKGYSKGGSINWQDFHALCAPGQMVVGDTPVDYCFTVNWSGPESGVPAVSGAFGAALGTILQGVAELVGARQS